MGRTNFVILGIGIGACVVLSLLMQHVIKVKNEHDVPPIVTELMKAHGQRFSDAAEFTVKHEDVGKVGELVIYPLMSASRRRLVRNIGDYVWRNLDESVEIVALTVICDDGLGKRLRYLVPSPRDVGRNIRELKDGETVRHSESTRRLPQRKPRRARYDRRQRPQKTGAPATPK